MGLNYLDAFSGIGGFHKGLEEAGLEFDWIGFSEINRYAKKVYKRHFPTAEDLGDVRTITSHNRLPGRLDLFTFGFPCQDLSMAGKRRGLHAERSGLFFEALRIIEAAKPAVFIFENVKGLLSSGDWGDFTTVLRSIADLGLYDCEWQLLNTRWLLPQNRERIYFIGHLRGRSRPQVFPIGEGDQDVIDLQRGVIGANAQTSGKGPLEQVLRVHSMQFRKKKASLREDGVFNCLVTGKNSVIETNRGIRNITPREGERLQGFPDGWTEGLSDTQRYKCLGNAVSVRVVRLIGQRLRKGLENSNRV